MVTLARNSIAMIPGALLPFSRRAEQTMGMPLSARRWTAAEVRELTDEERPWPRYELIDGELLVTPGPRPCHQIAVAELFLLLTVYVRGEELGLVIMSPSDIQLEPETITQPDVFAVPAIFSKGLREWHTVKSLLLAVEVISPSSVRSDREVKRKFYLRAGVPEYWVVDLDARSVERWRTGDDRPEVLLARLEWRPRGSVVPLVVDLDAFFTRIAEATG
jgi:Uma2 family endonuclease